MSGKGEKQKRESRLARFWRETVGELRKVSWPSRQQATRMTIIVLIVMSVMSIFLFIVDNIAGVLLKLAIGS
ncbi:MAG: preprotein translocase subunit SecE [Anaerolineaceae bacterium]|nr:MAG: preprotein translocase subunit SecE [Anaerolineaceae bacterium]